jgi:hypothetical protein
LRATPRQVALAERHADVDAAEDLLDHLVWDNELAPGDRLTRPGSETTVLIADSLPPGSDEPDTVLVFLTTDGHLYRFVHSAWTRELDLLEFPA